MIKLQDYIGGLVSSVTNARVLSDQQTAQIAEQYASHSLLQHFSVPRMRIDDIEFTVPVAIDDSVKEESIKIPAIDNVSFNSLTYKTLLSKTGLTSLPAEMSQDIRSEIARMTQKLESNLVEGKKTPIIKHSEDLVKHFEMTVNSSTKLKRQLSQSVDFSQVATELEKTLSSNVKTKDAKVDLNSLNVIVEANKLKEQKSENLIYIKLKISEEGMEWNRFENKEGEIETQLLTE